MNNVKKETKNSLKCDIVRNDFIIFIKENGIIHGTFIKDIFWDYEKAIEVVELRKKLNDSGPNPLLLEVEHTKGISKRARDYLASDIGMEGLTACALLVKSHVGKFAGNLFMALNKPKLPMRLFEDIHAAKHWLERHKKFGSSN